MKVRRLQVEENQMAQIRVEFQMGRISVDSPLRTIQQIEHQSARMRITRQDPNIETDMEELRNNIGLKNSGTLIREMASDAVSHLNQAVRTIQRDGRFYAALPHNGNPVAQIARKNVLAAPDPATAGDVIDPTVDIQGNPGSISIDWSLQEVTIVWDDYQAPVIRLDPKPYINVELAQEQRISFKVVEQSIPRETGRTIDEEG